MCRWDFEFNSNLEACSTYLVEAVACRPEMHKVPRAHEWIGMSCKRLRIGLLALATMLAHQSQLSAITPA